MFDLQGYAILFFALLSTILLQRLVRKNDMKMPPSPLALPIIGHLHLLYKGSHKALFQLSKTYGPLFRVFLGSNPCIVVSSPLMAREFLKTHEISFCNRPTITAIHYLTYNAQDLAFSPYGDYWKFMKKICMSQLLGGLTLDMLHPVRRDEIKRLIESIARKSSSGMEVDVRGEMIRMINNVISRMIMSRRCSAEDNEAEEIRKLIEEASKISGKPNLSDLFWFCKSLDLQGFRKKLKKIRDSLDEMFERIIEEHKEEMKRQKQNGQGDAKNLLDILIKISEDETSEFKLTGENIKAFIMDMFTGGTGTSANAIEWALAELINHPKIMKKAAQEIDSVVGKNRLVEESDIPKLPYLQAVVKETLRLHPPGGPFIGRESTQNCYVEEFYIPSKTRLLVNVWAINRDPNYWDSPLEFRPERFVNQEGGLKAEMDVRGQNYHFLPFGSGRRGCPGTSLGLHVVQTSLAAMIQCFEWNGTVNMEEGGNSSLSMAHPLVCVPVPRLTPLPLCSL